MYFLAFEIRKPLLFDYLYIHRHNSTRYPDRTWNRPDLVMVRTPVRKNCVLVISNTPTHRGSKKYLSVLFACIHIGYPYAYMHLTLNTYPCTGGSARSGAAGRPPPGPRPRPSAPVPTNKDDEGKPYFIYINRERGKKGAFYDRVCVLRVCVCVWPSSPLLRKGGPPPKHSPS